MSTRDKVVNATNDAEQRGNRKLLNIKNAFLIMLFACLFTTINPAYGNDAVYHGSGVTVYPVKHDNIQLVSEVITITKGVGPGL